ncbi:hypothetical protein [Actinoplanes philippinensis]|uniref:hypothetical protein n=1 Tax=Actinoplanes philippinensis TaxID=35752 RepID=UPI0033D2623B
MQPAYLASDTYIGRQVQALTAYEFGAGAPMWQAGTPDPRVATIGTDIPAEVYDLDGDGEDLAVMEGMFRVFDGRTGTLVREFPVPGPNAWDTIVIANLRGLDHPRDLVFKDRYEQVRATDEYGTLLWTHRGVTGHRPYPHDFDDDGRQERTGGTAVCCGRTPTPSRPSRSGSATSAGAARAGGGRAGSGRPYVGHRQGPTTVARWSTM